MESATRLDYYAVLGVSRDADADEIKRAYRALARELHPDVSEAAESDERFRQVAEAYRVLSKPTTRRLYDLVGGLDFSTIEFVLGRWRRPPVTEVRIGAFEAAEGTSRRIEIPNVEVCGACGGDGAQPGSSVEPCGRCAGKGMLKEDRTNEEAHFVAFTRCPECQGVGRFVRTPCEQCGGTGRSVVKRVLKLNVPAGIRDGEQLALDLGAERDDDAYVTVRVSPPPKDSAVARAIALVALAVAVAVLVYVLTFL